MFNDSTYPFNFMTTGDGVDSDLVIPDSFGQCLSYEQQIAFILKLIEDIDTGVIVPDITADATVDQSTGTPSVTVVKTGEDEAPVFTFNFHNIKGETGQRGEKGEQGEQGETGRPGNDGADGISPTVTTAQIANGYRITITDADGSHVFDIYNGNDGETGPAGYSPTVTVQTITGGHTVTITDEDGDHSFNVMDGIDGTDGVDGVSPSISVTSITGGHQVSITDAQGTDTFNVMDGVDGTDGSDGSDGVSPVITSTAITGGHRITIVDAQGTTNVDVMDGATGATGNGIASTVLNQDYTLTITYTDGTTYTTPSIRGAQGAAGQNGTDGISPTVTVTDHTNYHHIEITSAGGTEQFDVYDGTDGSDGTDGISPTVTVRSITGGHQIEIVSAGGTEQFDVMDGSDGATGATGPAGPGLPAGGTAGQMIIKSSSADYATQWVNRPFQETFVVGLKKNSNASNRVVDIYLCKTYTGTYFYKFVFRRGRDLATSGWTLGNYTQERYTDISSAYPENTVLSILQLFGMSDSVYPDWNPDFEPVNYSPYWVDVYTWLVQLVSYNFTPGQFMLPSNKSFTGLINWTQFDPTNTYYLSYVKRMDVLLQRFSQVKATIWLSENPTNASTKMTLVDDFEIVLTDSGIAP